MKCWRYYLKPQKKDKEILAKLTAEGKIGLKDKYPLFAITADKKIKDLFEKVYDMSKMIKKTSKMTKDEFAEYANSNQHRGKILELYELTGVKNHWKDNEEVFTVIMPITFITRQHLEDIFHPGFNADYWTDYQENYIQPKEVRDGKYKNALYAIGYTAAYQYYFGDFDNVYDEMGYDALGNIPQVRCNTLDWFINQYRNILAN